MDSQVKSLEKEIWGEKNTRHQVKNKRMKWQKLTNLSLVCVIGSPFLEKDEWSQALESILNKNQFQVIKGIEGILGPALRPESSIKGFVELLSRRKFFILVSC